MKSSIDHISWTNRHRHTNRRKYTAKTRPRKTGR